MQINAKMAGNTPAKTTSDAPSVQANEGYESPVGFAHFEQHIEQLADVDNAPSAFEMPQIPVLGGAMTLPPQGGLSPEHLAGMAEHAEVPLAAMNPIPSITMKGLSQTTAIMESGGQLPSAQIRTNHIDRQGFVQMMANGNTATPAAADVALAQATMPQAIRDAMSSDRLPAEFIAQQLTNQPVLKSGHGMAQAMDALMAQSFNLLSADGAVSSVNHAHSLSAATQGASQLTSQAQQAASANAQLIQASVDIRQPEWGRDLIAQLRSRIELKQGEGLQHAHVRLDPPELGKLDITLRMEGDKVSVHFNAAHPQLREALIAHADRLRFELDGSQLALGQVSVSAENGQGQQGGEQTDDTAIAANQSVISSTASDSDNTESSRSDGYESLV